jgi:hypothetical protein
MKNIINLTTKQSVSLFIFPVCAGLFGSYIGQKINDKIYNKKYCEKFCKK